MYRMCKLSISLLTPVPTSGILALQSQFDCSTHLRFTLSNPYAGSQRQNESSLNRRTLPTQDHTTSKYTSDARVALQQASAILAEHYGIKLVSLIKFAKSKNRYLPKEHRFSETDLAKAIYGDAGDRRQVNELLKKYGGAQ